jgi:hypothetical protein
MEFHRLAFGFGLRETIGMKQPHLKILSQQNDPALKGRCSSCVDVTFSLSQSTESLLALIHGMFLRAFSQGPHARGRQPACRAETARWSSAALNKHNNLSKTCHSEKQVEQRQAPRQTAQAVLQRKSRIDCAIGQAE